MPIIQQSCLGGTFFTPSVHLSVCPPCLVCSVAHCLFHGLYLYVTQMQLDFICQIVLVDNTENIKALHYWPFVWGEFTSEWWVLHHKRPVMRKAFLCYGVIMKHTKLKLCVQVLGRSVASLKVCTNKPPSFIRICYDLSLWSWVTRALFTEKNNARELVDSAVT